MSKLQQATANLNSADELRALIETCEKILANLDPTNASKLISTREQAARYVHELQSQRADIRAEMARLKGVDDRMTNNARKVVNALGGDRAYATMKPDNAKGAWWKLDEAIAAQRAAQRRTIDKILLVAFAVVAVAYFARDWLFPPNPVGNAINDAVTAFDAGDIPSAISAIDAGLQITTANAELNLWRGALGQLRGEAQATDKFAVAQRSLSAEDFLLERAQVYLRIKDVDRAMSDLNAAIAQSPQSAVGYYLRATAFEAKSDRASAISDLQKASELAEAQKLDTLNASARVRLGMLLQQR
jgi:tetratricopeptide (TPR) repeat protein